ncbi:MAG: SGNH/GDSL hydrolase family protein [Bacteriovorax sp.]|nr:SGNH/GDSL hydrolase family protein [Bacteriovorax sp.]
MKNKNKVIIVIIASSAFFILLLLSIIQNPIHRLEDYSEIEHSLFGQLDPILGYAHNEKYKRKDTDKELKISFNNNEYTHYSNGFVGLTYKANENPKRIVILGSSSTDPYLFAGNWALRFHDLLIKINIPHIIYNGAVSGYNSTQILNKLERDVFSLGKIDLVISYLGGNDFIGNEDILENHPGIHPYQKRLFENIKISLPADISEWNKLKFAIQQFIKKPAKDMQLGVINPDNSQNLVKNIQYMKAVCDVNEVAYMHVMEVVISNESQRINGTKLSSVNQGLEKNMSNFLGDVYLHLKKKNYVYSIQEKIPSNQKIFYDSVHLSEEGNAILAAQIFNLALNLTSNPLISR